MLNDIKAGSRVAITPSDEEDRVYYGTVCLDGHERKYVVFDDENPYYPSGKDIVRELK